MKGSGGGRKVKGSAVGNGRGSRGGVEGGEGSLKFIRRKKP